LFEIHQALISPFSLLAEFLIGKVLAKDKDSRALKLANLNPGCITRNIFKIYLSKKTYKTYTKLWALGGK
jgi:hypothetical protein